MADKDPHGAIISLVSVSVVFSALIILYFSYTLIGKISSGKLRISMPEKRKKLRHKTGIPEEEAAAIAMALDQEINGEVYAAIGLALDRYLGEKVHDMESFIITIRRKNR